MHASPPLENQSIFLSFALSILPARFVHGHTRGDIPRRCGARCLARGLRGARKKVHLKGRVKPLMDVPLALRTAEPRSTHCYRNLFPTLANWLSIESGLLVSYMKSSGFYGAISWDEILSHLDLLRLAIIYKSKPSSGWGILWWLVKPHLYPNDEVSN